MPNWTSNRIEAPAEVLKKYVKMSDLIRREAALNQITAIDTSIIPYAKAREYVDELKNYVIKIIEALPSAEPERKNGKWIEYPDCLRYEGAYNDDHIVCSECGHVFSICDNCTEEFDFCPHCGADMRGE